MSKKVADQFVEMIEKAGIKNIYAVTGDSLNFINDAVRRHNTVKWIHVRHEETGAFAAAAEAEIHGIGCCAGSSGPGHVHLINGLYDAHRSDAPVLAVASTCISNEYGTSYFQETDVSRLFGDCSGYTNVATTPQQFPRILQSALQYAIGRKGVVVVGVPGDLAASEAADSITSEKVFRTPVSCRPSDSELKKLAELINKSEKITLFCGTGARGAHDEIVELASLVNSPVAYTFRSKMDIQYNNPFEIGMTGLLGLPSAYKSMHHSDLLLMLGTDFPYETFMPHNYKIVQLDVRPERIGRRAKVDYGFAGDIKETLKALTPLIEKKKSREFLDDILDDYAHRNKLTDKAASKKGVPNNIAPEYVMTCIDKYADSDAVFTVDTGMCCVWGARYITATGKRRMLGSFHHGSMANAMPMAIGAACAAPDKQIVAICGDGGLSMLLGDLATIVQYKLPVKLFVFNNRSLGMVKLEMEVAGLPDWQTDMYNPDFAKVAEAMGIKSYSVTDPDKVEETVKTALSHAGPVLVSIDTDPNALALPPKITMDQMRGFAESMAKLAAEGNLEEIADTVKSNIKHIWEII
ncbi:MAG: thiamine pyrophosphate-dependent enzyme [Rikenellaceae bacterium]|nr:thiamine pyrophosphate-dependent enzyme [Rikenellaceae bacterium]